MVAPLKLETYDYDFPPLSTMMKPDTIKQETLHDKIIKASMSDLTDLPEYIFATTDSCDGLWHVVPGKTIPVDPPIASEGITSNTNNEPPKNMTATTHSDLYSYSVPKTSTKYRNPPKSMTKQGKIFRQDNKNKQNMHSRNKRKNSPSTKFPYELLELLSAQNNEISDTIDGLIGPASVQTPHQKGLLSHFVASQTRLIHSYH